VEPLEIEVKFFLKKRMAVRSQILKLGARSLGRFFEKNIRFENENNSFGRKNSLLRLRQDQKTTLTFKSESADTDRQFKIHKELEVEISDFGSMVQILECAGFHQAQMYEKWRETLVLNNTSFCLDTMPFGEFLEVEGTKSEIIKWTNKIGLQWGKRILLNYLTMFRMIKEKEKLTFSDITFQNFKTSRIDPEKYLPFFEANRK
jgi:adenylate cyclase class 2